MFNRDRFHNQLAMNLGYQRLLNDNCYDLKVEETEDDAISVCIMGNGRRFNYKEPENDYESCIKNAPPVIREVINAVHKAYMEAQRPLCG